MSSKKKGPADPEENEEEEKAIKEAGKKKEEVIDDDDDAMSDEEKDIQNEINLDIDGNVKVSKVHRGYDEDNNDEGDEEMKPEKDDESVSSTEKPKKDKETRKRTDSNGSGIEKYTKPLREAHSKYLQYLKDINFDKNNNIASINVAFPLSFKKVLMLTLAEQTLEKVLVRSINNIEKCTLIKPKNDSDEPYLIV